MEYIINGEEVEVFEQKEKNGKIIINYKKKFNVKNASQLDILHKLIDNNIKAHPSIYQKQKIIIIYLKNINDAYSVIDCLKLYQNDYEIDYEQELIVIDI